MRSIFYTLLFLFTVFPCSSQDSGKPCLPVKDNLKYQDVVFQNGETLRYIMNYKWGAVNTDVGEANLLLQYFANSGEPYFHATATGRTYKFYDILFPVRDFYESKFYCRNLRPFYFHRDILEGKYRMKNYFTFMPNYQVKTKTQKYNKPPKDSLLNGRICTFDILSLFYFARNKDFSTDKIGVEQPISFVIDNDIYDLYYRYLGKCIKRVPGLGTFHAIKFAARVIAGEVFSGKEELVFWVTDDDNKIPLYFESPIIVGRVAGRLAGYSNLKYPISCKIK